MMNDIAPEVSRRKPAAWGAFKSIEDVVKRTKNIRLRNHLFDSTVLPAPTYASETWSRRKQNERSLSVFESAIERTVPGAFRFTQVRDGNRSSHLRQRSRIKDTVLHAELSKIMWAGYVVSMNDNRWTGTVSDWIPRDVKHTAGKPPTQWSAFFTKSLEERYDARRDRMFLEQAEPTGLLLHVIGKSGGFTGACSSHSTINGTAGEIVPFLIEQGAY
uniref:Integrase n=1 Tax=Angiostrongylus cantonensis TaxID=6313 RepID=A0A0K0DK24_ANGCA